jgi:transcriptional regulator with XRE-family HTH domain
MCDVIDVHLGRRLRGRRRSLGLTQAELADCIGVRFQQIQKYECAANKMSAAMIWRLAHVLQVETRYFYDGLEQRKPLAVATSAAAAAPAETYANA